MTAINIYHLYPEHLNLYGDRGNVLALSRRAGWHGLNANIIPVQPGGQIDFTDCDILFMGGGQDYEQELIAGDLKGRRDDLLKAVDDGMVILAICGSYQLLGQSYTTARGERIPGLEILDLYSEAGHKRMIGNVVINCSLWDPPRTLVGFENHGGRTFLGPEVQPLGTVVKGHGNNGIDKTEGVIYKNIIGTYLHGSLLPKNPWLTDYLIQKALDYRNQPAQLKTLDETIEERAHQAAIRLAKSRLHKIHSSRF